MKQQESWILGVRVRYTRETSKYIDKWTQWLKNPNKKFWTTLLEDITAMRDETILVESLSNMLGKVDGGSGGGKVNLAENTVGEVCKYGRQHMKV